jgi:hypothetical protein
VPPCNQQSKRQWWGGMAGGVAVCWHASAMHHLQALLCPPSMVQGAAALASSAAPPATRRHHCLMLSSPPCCGQRLRPWEVVWQAVLLCVGMAHQSTICKPLIVFAIHAAGRRRLCTISNTACHTTQPLPHALPRCAHIVAEHEEAAVWCGGRCCCVLACPSDASFARCITILPSSAPVTTRCTACT